MPFSYLTCSSNEVMNSTDMARFHTIYIAEGNLAPHVVGGIPSSAFYSRLVRAASLRTVQYTGLVLLNHAAFVKNLPVRCHEPAVELAHHVVPGISGPLMRKLLLTQTHGSSFDYTDDDDCVETLFDVLYSLRFGEDPWEAALRFLDAPEYIVGPPAPPPKATHVAAAPAFPYRPKTVRSY